MIFSIMLIGGAFLILDKCGLIKYSMQLVIRRFEKKKYVLLAAVTLFCMLLGAGMGVFEETVILAPIAVALAVSLRWDALVGAGMSLIAVGFGFAAGVFNPFSTGVAQRLAGLPLFSGLWLRIIMFVVIYGILVAFLLLYARRIEKNPEKSLLYGLKSSSARFSPDEATTGADAVNEDTKIHSRKCKRGLIFFGACLLFIAIYVTAGAFVPELTDFSMPVIALLIPLLAPLAEMVGLTRQSIVLAFTLGDGFANVLYPTNAVLLIVLGIIGVPYLTWLKWTWKLQALFIIISIGFLTLAHSVAYGPF